MPLDAGLSLSEINQILTIVTAFVIPAIGFVVAQVRGHLRRISKIETDLNVAHRRIRKLIGGGDAESELECESKNCPHARSK